jgi:hypothetical protein
VEDILAGAGGFDTKTIRTAIVTFRDIRKLLPDTWLNDEVDSFNNVSKFIEESLMVISRLLTFTWNSSRNGHNEATSSHLFIASIVSFVLHYLMLAMPN